VHVGLAEAGAYWMFIQFETAGQLHTAPITTTSS
jgi:hypothetical protein